MELEATLEIEKYKSRIRLLFFAFTIFSIAIFFSCIGMRAQMDGVNDRVLLLEKQQKSMQDKSDAEFDDLNDQVSGLYKRVQALEEQARKSNQHIWL
jgi:hypothetical protein